MSKILMQAVFHLFRFRPSDRSADLREILLYDTLLSVPDYNTAERLAHTLAG